MTNHCALRLALCLLCFFLGGLAGAQSAGSPAPRLGMRATSADCRSGNTATVSGSWRCPVGYRPTFSCGSGPYGSDSSCRCQTTPPHGQAPGTFTCRETFARTVDADYISAYLRCDGPYVAGRLNYWYDSGTGSLLVACKADAGYAGSVLPERWQYLGSHYIGYLPQDGHTHAARASETSH